MISNESLYTFKHEYKVKRFALKLHIAQFLLQLRIIEDFSKWFGIGF